MSAIAAHLLVLQCNRLHQMGNYIQVSFTMTTLGSTASYHCISGYTLSENITRRCEADGTWSGTEPTCGELMCEYPKDQLMLTC